jgi:hypothetical protein
MRRNPFRSSVVLLTLVAAAAVARPAFAGPPLLCHPYDIAGARSLPWDGSTGWFQGRADYKLTNLVSDTEALLTPTTPVIARMETLRRATIYASADRTVAAALLDRLTARARAAELAGRADALAYLDVAYVTEAMREMTMLGREMAAQAANARAVTADANGLAWMRKSLAAGGGNPALDFAAALISSAYDRSAYFQHAAKARAGASRDVLLAKNLDHIS